MTVRVGVRLNCNSLNLRPVDLVIEYQGRVWLLEFKLADADGGERALDQIKARGYHQRYAGRLVTLIGMDFSRAQRNLVGFAWERA